MVILFSFPFLEETKNSSTCIQVRFKNGERKYSVEDCGMLRQTICLKSKSSLRLGPLLSKYWFKLIQTADDTSDKLFITSIIILPNSPENNLLWKNENEFNLSRDVHYLILFFFFFYLSLSLNSQKGDPLEARKSNKERIYQTRFYWVCSWVIFKGATSLTPPSAGLSSVLYSKRTGRSTLIPKDQKI